MLLEGIILSLIAGLAITAGAGFASINLFRSVWIREEFRHGIIAFGGGALISAVAFVLIPDGAEHQANVSTILTFLSGGIAFMIIDRILANAKSNLAQFMAMMLDFIPEAIVLGAVIAEDYTKAVFIAIVIAAQNLPEGYAAFTEMQNKHNKKKLLGMFLLVGISGPVYILLGSEVFAHYPNILGMMMTFCAGGILYLVFEDIAPHAVMKKHWLPPFGAVAGFTVGLIGYLYI
jgi:ZIP family zinc transporter